MRVVAAAAGLLVGGADAALAQGAPWREEAVTLPAGTGELRGTLLLPAGEGPWPVALLIAGSGPTDRDGNTRLPDGTLMANNSLRLLAEGLAAAGVAAVRYDKRGIGDSESAALREDEMRFDHMVEDAAGWVDLLRRDDRFGPLTVVGHSEGSLVGLLAARRTGVAGFVSVAGVGRPAADVMATQLRAAALPEPLLGQMESALAELAAGRTPGEVSPLLASLVRPSVHGYLISWFRYDPAAELRGFEGPVLIVQGTHDIQVPVEEARLLAEARPDARLLLIEGMNHVLKDAPADRAAQMPIYADAARPLAEGLVEAIAAFARGH
jgi:uncharacterized protein